MSGRIFSETPTAGGCISIQIPSDQYGQLRVKIKTDGRIS